MPEQNNEIRERWLHDRTIFGHGISCMLLLSSLLFLGYATLKDTWLGIIISIIGLSSGTVAAGYFWYMQKRLKEMERALSLNDIYQIGVKRIQWIAIWIFLFFTSIWVSCLLYTIIVIPDNAKMP